MFGWCPVRTWAKILTVSSEVFRSFTEGRPGRCWDSNPTLTTDVFHILCSSLFTDIQFSGCVYPEHGELRRYSWLALLGSSRKLTRRIEKLKNLRTKYDRTVCLVRILITLNRPEPELLTTSLNKLQTRKWALCGMQQYGIDVFYRQYFWWSSTVVQRRGQVHTCLRSRSALWTLVFSSCVVFSYEFHMSWPTTFRVTSCFKGWFNQVKSSVALLPACFLAKSSLADFQVGGNCIYQDHRREGSDTGCILLKRVPLHGALAVRPCSVMVRTVTK